MSDVDDNLSNALNLPQPIKSEPAATEQPVVDAKSIEARLVKPDSERDYAEVRQNLKRIIEKSEEAVESILEVAIESQNPRAYEVVAQLLAASLEANNKLMHLHRQIKDIKKDEPGKTTNVTNNSIFVGNTADLQKMIRNMNTVVPPKQLEDKDAS
jgi:hypothetical protein